MSRTVRGVRATVAAALALGLGVAGCSGAPAGPGPTLEVFGPWRGVEADRFEGVLDDFEDETGIEVRYTGSSDLAADVQRRVNDARPPDVAIVPQPGLVAELADLGALSPLPARVEATVDEAIQPGIVDLATFDGDLVGVPYRVTVKGLVWYSPELFAAHGWELPVNLHGMLTLTRRIQAAGIHPWCAGIEAFGATGWVMTDWVEGVMLRQSGPDDYDDWVAGDLAFADPEVAAAFDVVDELLLQRGRVLGSTSGLLGTPVDEAILPLLDDEPACAMHQNGSFTVDWLPDGTQVGPFGDVDAFVLPGVDPDDETPLTVGVDIAVPMNGRDPTAELLGFLATPEGGRAWAAEGGYLGGRFTEAEHGSVFDSGLADLIDQADVVRADASDQMPPAFGSDAYWELVSGWAAGLLSTGDLLQILDIERDEAAG